MALQNLSFSGQILRFGRFGQQDHAVGLQVGSRTLCPDANFEDRSRNAVEHRTIRADGRLGSRLWSEFAGRSSFLH